MSGAVVAGVWALGLSMGAIVVLAAIAGIAVALIEPRMTRGDHH